MDHTQDTPDINAPLLFLDLLLYSYLSITLWAVLVTYNSTNPVTALSVRQACSHLISVSADNRRQDTCTV